MVRSTRDLLLRGEGRTARFVLDLGERLPDQGTDSDDAWSKADLWARENEGDSDGSLRWNERPATLRYAGIRKLITVSHWDEEGRLEHRDEITYSEFAVADRESIERLVAGDEVDVRYVE